MSRQKRLLSIMHKNDVIFLDRLSDFSIEMGEKMC